MLLWNFGSAERIIAFLASAVKSRDAKISAHFMLLAASQLSLVKPQLPDDGQHSRYHSHTYASPQPPRLINLGKPLAVPGRHPEFDNSGNSM
jgi:hypothetical protein